jgi:hypothetical protein
MPVFHVELLIHEVQQVAVKAENEDLARRFACEGMGHWIEWPSRTFDTKIKREISTEEWERIKTPGFKNQKQGV